MITLTMSPITLLPEDIIQVKIFIRLKCGKFNCYVPQKIFLNRYQGFREGYHSNEEILITVKGLLNTIEFSHKTIVCNDLRPMKNLRGLILYESKIKFENYKAITPDILIVRFYYPKTENIMIKVGERMLPIDDIRIIKKMIETGPLVGSQCYCLFYVNYSEGVVREDKSEIFTIDGDQTGYAVNLKSEKIIIKK